MPVFGKSLFETVLDGMEPEDDDDEDSSPSAATRSGLGWGFVVGTSGVDDVPVSDGAVFYDDFLEGLPEPVLASPAWLDRLAISDVQEDLGDLSGLTHAQIKLKRRAFARENHPDTVLALYREQANIRMTLANQIFDAALRQAKDQA